MPKHKDLVSFNHAGQNKEFTQTWDVLFGDWRLIFIKFRQKPSKTVVSECFPMRQDHRQWSDQDSVTNSLFDKSGFPKYFYQ